MPEKVHTRFDDDGPSPAKKPRLQDIPATKPKINGNSSKQEKSQVPAALPSKDPRPVPKNVQHVSSRPPHVPSLKQKAQGLLPARKSLPIWPQAPSIRKALNTSDVLLLVGETGSGKSTQIPQFLLDEPWCQERRVSIPRADGPPKKAKVGGCVAITQPRRVAAINLARRVAEEMGTTLGSASPASKVGYSVRFDNCTSPCTRVKFLTEGMLLQEMLRDPWLTQYSAVVVDEVHERGVNVDLVLGFLRMMVKGGKEGRGGVCLKVVVMSATAEMESLKTFFGDEEEKGDEVEQSTREAEDETEAESEWSGFSDNDDNSTIQPDGNGTNGDTTTNHDKGAPGEYGTSTSNGVSVCHIEGRQYPVKMIYSPKPVQDIVESSLLTVFQINQSEPMPGDILVFLTGQSTVESLTSLVTEYSASLSPKVPKLLALPLFAALPQSAQQRVFHPAPPRTRKVIISTNIAETSVTVPGVRFVIDSGKSKTKQFRSRLGLDSLLVKPVSKSAAIQRAGRAGREAPGTCYRLYTQPDFEALVQSAQPEILRSDLAHCILTLKARGVGDISSFPFLTTPPRDALEKALLQLFTLDALTPEGRISAVGLALARLPLSAPLGRALLASAEPEGGCLAEMIDVVAALSVEKVFLPLADEESREKAETARRGLYRREGDHATLLATVRGFVDEGVDRRVWAERHWVSLRAMQSVMDVRKQLLALAPELMKAAGSVGVDGKEKLAIPTTPSDPVSLLKALLKGFATNTALLMPDGSYQTVVGRQNVAIHPSSVLFGKKVEAIVYSEYVFTSKSYARGVSAIEGGWITEALKA